MGLGVHLWGWESTYGAGGRLTGQGPPLTGQGPHLWGKGPHLWVKDRTYGAGTPTYGAELPLPVTTALRDVETPRAFRASQLKVALRFNPMGGGAQS